MRSYQEIEFEKRMNGLRIDSLQRMAVATDPRTLDFESIVQEIRTLEKRQKELMIEGVTALSAEEGAGSCV